VARIGARLLLQTALEAEVSEFLGRERYARSASSDNAREGMRNGYCDTTIKTTTGPVTLSRPKLRGTSETFASRLLGTGVTKTHALESLVIAGFVRGLSTRDVEATLAEALGEQASVSRSTVSRICTEIAAEMAAWQQRRLDEVELDYLFLDASFFRYHVGAAAEPVLAAWGITTEGTPVFVGLDTCAGESTDGWAAFLTDLGTRGLRCPLLVISDGAPGLISAVEQTMPAALRQRCLIHRARNLLSKIPKNAQARSRPTTGRSSRCPRQSSPVWTRSPTSRARSTSSCGAGATPTRRRCARCCPTATASPTTCASRASTGPGSGTPTSSNAPSVRPGVG
jgi:putative transposase